MDDDEELVGKTEQELEELLETVQTSLKWLRAQQGNKSVSTSQRVTNNRQIVREEERANRIEAVISKTRTTGGAKTEQRVPAERQVVLERERTEKESGDRLLRAREQAREAKRKKEEEERLRLASAYGIKHVGGAHEAIIARRENEYLTLSEIETTTSPALQTQRLEAEERARREEQERAAKYVESLERANSREPILSKDRPNHTTSQNGISREETLEEKEARWQREEDERVAKREREKAEQLAERIKYQKEEEAKRQAEALRKKQEAEDHQKWLAEELAKAKREREAQRQAEREAENQRLQEEMRRMEESLAARRNRQPLASPNTPIEELKIPEFTPIPITATTLTPTPIFSQQSSTIDTVAVTSEAYIPSNAPPKKELGSDEPRVVQEAEQKHIDNPAINSVHSSPTEPELQPEIRKQETTHINTTTNRFREEPDESAVAFVESLSKPRAGPRHIQPSTAAYLAQKAAEKDAAERLLRCRQLTVESAQQQNHASTRDTILSRIAQSKSVDEDESPSSESPSQSVSTAPSTSRNPTEETEEEKERRWKREEQERLERLEREKAERLAQIAQFQKSEEERRQAEELRKKHEKEAHERWLAEELAKAKRERELELKAREEEEKQYYEEMKRQMEEDQKQTSAEEAPSITEEAPSIVEHILPRIEPVPSKIEARPRAEVTPSKEDLTPIAHKIAPAEPIPVKQVSAEPVLPQITETTTAVVETPHPTTVHLERSPPRTTAPSSTRTDPKVYMAEKERLEREGDSLKRSIELAKESARRKEEASRGLSTRDMILARREEQRRALLEEEEAIRAAEAKRVDEEKRVAEAKKAEEERRLAEEKRKAEEKVQAETARKTTELKPITANEVVDAMQARRRQREAEMARLQAEEEALRIETEQRAKAREARLRQILNNH
ncbi:hypothetical protein Pelo_11744 [Pelomyxa schiedti]|nr:hypothetical protein Pelo_11744 [Pelomyxa schiedti]